MANGDPKGTWDALNWTYSLADHKSDLSQAWEELKMRRGENPESVVARLWSLMIELEMKAGVAKTDTKFHHKLFSVLPEEHREEIKEHWKKLRKGEVDQLVMQEALDDLAQAHRDHICKLLWRQGEHSPKKEADQALAAAAEMDPDMEGAYDTQLDGSQAAPTADANVNKGAGTGPSGNQSVHHGNPGAGGPGCGGHNQGNGSGCGGQN